MRWCQQRSIPPGRRYHHRRNIAPARRTALPAASPQRPERLRSCWACLAPWSTPRLQPTRQETRSRSCDRTCSCRSPPMTCAFTLAGPKTGQRYRIGLMHGDYPQKVRQQTEWPCREDKSPPSPGVNRGCDPQLKDLASPGLQRPVRSDAVLSYLARFIDGPWRSLPLRRHSYCRWEPAALAPGCRRGCTAAYRKAWWPRCCLAAVA